MTFDINIAGDGITYEAFVKQHEDIKENLSYGNVHINSVFEVGCGCGAGLYLLHKEGYSIGGIDYSEKMITIAEEIFSKGELTECICGEAIHMPIDIQYDAILSNSVFAYFPDWDYAEAVLEKMLKKARYSIGLIDLYDAAKEEDFLRYRKQAIADYEERYKNLPKLFCDKQLFEKFADKHNCKIRFTESVMNGYWNNPYIFNCFLYKQ